MNLKALALSSVLAVGGMFGGMAPAEAATCWFDNGRGGLSATYCPHNVRTNANGHRVIDVVDHQGTNFTLIFWFENYGDNYGDVEILYTSGQYAGTRVVGEWEYDSDGDRRIYVGEWEMAIRL